MTYFGVIWQMVWRDWSRDWVVIGFSLVFMALMATAGFIQQQRLDELAATYQTQQAQIQGQREKGRDELREIEQRGEAGQELFGTPQSYFSWATTNTYYPFHEWSVWAVGRSDLYAPINRINFYQPPRLAGNDLANPMPRLFGHFDPAFVLIYLLPLFVLALNYRLISGEREFGRLQMVLANPISVPRWLGIQCLARFVITLAVVVLSLLAVCLVAQLNPFARLTASFCLLLIVAGYTLFWFALCVLVNVLFDAANRCAAVLSVLWMAFLLFLPAVAHLLGSVFFPQPSVIDLVSANRQATSEARRQGAELLAAFYQDHPELSRDRSDQFQQHKATFEWYQRTFAVYEWVEAATEPLRQAGRQRQQQRSTLEWRLAGFSPAVLTQRAISELAFVSQAHFRQHEADVSDFARQWRTFFKAKAFAERVIESGDIERMPLAQFTAEPRQKDTLFAALGLWLQALGLLGLAIICGRRLKLR